MNVSAPGQELTLDELARVAADLWVGLPPGSVVWLTGELGSGKTTFVKALARVADAGDVHSPTFALVHEYSSPAGLVVHVDCYRLRHPDEALDLDFAGALRVARLLLIEWPEHAGAYAPAPNAHLHFTHGDRVEKRRVERLR